MLISLHWGTFCLERCIIRCITSLGHYMKVTRFLEPTTYKRKATVRFATCLKRQRTHGTERVCYLCPCDVASFSDYSRLETAKRDRCCPENRAMCSDVWKRHSLAPATRHMNTQDQGRRQQETHTPTAKTIYRRNVRSPTTRHRIRNEKRARNQR